MNFQIKALPRSHFAHLFSLSPEELARHRAVRVTASKKPGFPCRVSLADAEAGESLLLVHYEHHTTESPFQASHAVYVRPHAQEAKLRSNEVPEQLRSRILSLRVYNRKGMMIAADLADGLQLEPAIDELFRNEAAAYIHIHYAKPGCYAACVERE